MLTQQRARPLLYMAAPRTFRQLFHANVTLPMDLQRHIAQGVREREAVIRVRARARVRVRVRVRVSKGLGEIRM